jgi:preprotein translocase subunit SecD
LQLVLSWPIRIVVIGLLLFSLFVDGSGYVFRFVNHLPMTGNVAGLPPNFGGWQLFFHRGLDLSGGTQLTLQMGNFPPGQDRATVQQRTIDILQKRVNALGTSEPLVQASGSNHDRIDVQLAGVSASQAAQVIGHRDQLVITTWVPDSSITGGPFPGYRPQMTQMTADMLQNASASLDPNGGTGWVVNFQFNGAGAGIFSQLSTTAYSACGSGGTGTCPQSRITNWLDLTPADIANWNTTAARVYQPFDSGGKLLSDPYIQQPITGGNGFIQGNFNQQSAQNLATSLNSGALPVSLDIVQSSDVGATLGADSVKRSLAAGLLGLVIIVIFMMAFYRLPGVLASLALLFYAGVLLAIFKAWPVTLTLAGLAGVILSVGMAVDANVLIFERFKEEMRAGRTIGAAVEAAVRRAWPAIRDSNTSTLITSLILFFASTGSVKGFALTLAIGVAISLVSSIIVTHNLLAIVLNFGWARTGTMLGVVARGRA